ncbi:hypothetical protein Ndes2526B_g04334 [Nannochloris sp. 'desiccata']|nr:hypothetical protein KSW81_000902 [Chlorella desiccata (nom. nud.)]KAH7620418.1 hypothetical protein NADE_003041 [Chlorella desiccata (nom. nud.)]
MSRRQLLTATTVISVVAPLLIKPTFPAEALPLAPLGKVEKHVGGDKLTNLLPEEVAHILARNLRDGQYFVTGDLTPEIFADDCRFKDPTNDVRGLSRYLTALGILFDANYSRVQLLDIQVTGPYTIEATWTLGGYLRFPWHPRVAPFEGKTLYSLSKENGLIEVQDQTWSISGIEALRESFTPTSGPKRDIIDA